MKKFISLLLSSAMMICATIGLSTNAYAGGWADSVEQLQFDTNYSTCLGDSDYSDGNEYYEAYIVNVPAKGSLSFRFESPYDGYYLDGLNVDIYNIKNTTKTVANRESFFSNNIRNYNYGLDSSRDVFYETFDVNLQAGNYYIVCKYDDDCTFEFDFSVKYTPNFGKTSISSLISKDNSFIAKWTKAANATGYQIRYSTKSNMSGAKVLNVKNPNTASKTVKGLKDKKKYYVSIRSYKTVNINGSNKTYYSKWSSKGIVKTK